MKWVISLSLKRKKKAQELSNLTNENFHGDPNFAGESHIFCNKSCSSLCYVALTKKQLIN